MLSWARELLENSHFCCAYVRNSMQTDNHSLLHAEYLDFQIKKMFYILIIGYSCLIDIIGAKKKVDPSVRFFRASHFVQFC